MLNYDKNLFNLTLIRGPYAFVFSQLYFQLLGFINQEVCIQNKAYDSLKRAKESLFKDIIFLSRTILLICFIQDCRELVELF